MDISKGIKPTVTMAVRHSFGPRLTPTIPGWLRQSLMSNRDNAASKTDIGILKATLEFWAAHAVVNPCFPIVLAGFCG